LRSIRWEQNKSKREGTMGLYLEDIEVGAEYTTASRTVTEADLVIYSGLSGDYNALHTDEEYCKRTPFGTRIAHGPLVYAMAMGLINRLGLTDGTSLGYLAVENWRFLGPVKPGDTITVKLTVADKRESSKGGRGILKRTVAVMNQRGEKVQEGTMVTMVEARPKETAPA
jgi:acyl dehydratase